MKRYGHNLRAGTEGDFYKGFLGGTNSWPEHQSVWFRNTTYCYRRSFFKFCTKVGIGGRQYRHCRLEGWCWLRWRRQVLEKATPVLLPGKSYGWRSLVGCSTWGREQWDMTERLHFHFSLSCIGEGNGNPLQCSCLENPRDGGACWAAVCGVTQSRTWLKWLSSSSSSWLRILGFIPCLVTN